MAGLNVGTPIPMEDFMEEDELPVVEEDVAEEEVPIGNEAVADVEVDGNVLEEPPFDYERAFDDMADDPYFRYRYLGDREARQTEGETISEEEWEEVVNAPTEEESRNIINRIIGEKARGMAEYLMSDIADEDEADRYSADGRDQLRGMMGGLADIDESYAYEYGEDGEIPFGDEAYMGTRQGGLLNYLVERGYTIEQLQDMPQSELYALASRVNGHENLMLRRDLESSAVEQPDNMPLLGGEGIEEEMDLDTLYGDQMAWDDLTDQALRGGDRELLKRIRDKERSVRDET